MEFSDIVDLFLYSYKFWFIFLLVNGVILGRHFLILLNCLNTAASGKTKYVLITDCEDELGYKIAINLCASKVYVVAGCSSEESVQRLEGDINFNGHAFVLDVTNDEHVENVYQQMKEHLQYIGLHGIINNKRIPHVSPIDGETIEDMNKVMQTNFWAMVKLTKRFLPWLKKMKGRIINLSNCNVELLSHTSSCNIATAATNAYSEALRQECKPWNVTVHVVDIGLDPCLSESMITDMWDKQWNGLNPIMQEQYGSDYYRIGMENMIQQYEKHKIQNISTLVNHFSDAVLSSNPRLTYHSSTRHSYVFLLLNLLPEHVKELIVGYMSNLPTPKILIRQKPKRRQIP